jgi:glutathione reductase (NADPH)
MGGTCVNVGCVPKKVCFNAASISEYLHDAPDYGFPLTSVPAFDWRGQKQKRDAYIERLRGMYDRNVAGEKVTVLYGNGEFVDSRTVRVTDKEGRATEYTADHICIATGGAPTWPEIEGKEMAIDSDGFFQLEE